MKSRSLLRRAGFSVSVAAILAAGCAYQRQIAQGDASAAKGDYAAALEAYRNASDAPPAIGDSDGAEASERIRKTRVAWAAALSERGAILEKAGHPGGAWLLFAKAASLEPKNVAYANNAKRAREAVQQWSDYPVVAAADDPRARETLENLGRTLDHDSSIRLVFAPSAPARAVFRLAFSEPLYQMETHEEERTAGRDAGGRGGRGGGRRGFGGGGGGSSQRMLATGSPATPGAYSGFGAGIASSQASIVPASATSATAAAGTSGKSAADLANPAPALGSIVPTLGNPLPVLGGALPALGNPTANVQGVPLPALGNVLPTLSNPLPSTSPLPAIGSGLPRLGSTSPALGSAAPALGNPGSRSLNGQSGAASPSIGTVASASANARVAGGGGGGRSSVVLENPADSRREALPARGTYTATVRTLTANSEVRGMIAHADGRPPISIDVPVAASGRSEANAAQRAIGVAAKPMETIHPELVAGYLTAQSTEAAHRALDASFQSWRAAILAGAEHAAAPESRIDALAVYALSDPRKLDPGTRERIDRAAEDFAGIKNASLLMAPL